VYDPLPPAPTVVELPPAPVTFSPRKFQNRRWRHLALFVLTVASTTLIGAEHYAGYISDFARQPVEISPALILHGFWYSGTILLILGTHELGHYLACRYYQVDASLPFFIPMPFVLTGTLGAFIRIREPIPTKRMLFDIGIAGPLAGFAFALPALFIGIALSSDGVRRMVRTTRHGAESFSHWTARRRPHLVCGPRQAIDGRHRRRDLHRDRIDVFLDELDRVDLLIGRDDARHGTAPSTHRR
jgi:hypothetical protein